MEPHSHPVTTALAMCDAFASQRFHGNSAAVCFVPTSVYCMEWSAVSSLEASFGRGEPDEAEQKMTEKERDESAERYARERHQKMGRAFQRVAQEVNLSETAFIYRLPASRIQTIQKQIMRKCNEFEHEYEEEVRQETLDRHRTSCAVTEDDEPAMDGATGAESVNQALHGHGIGEATSPHLPGLIPSTSFSMAYFGASFLDTRGSSMSMVGGGSDKRRPRRMHTQWFGLRWFTPKCEVPMCGHATFAAAHAIFEASRLCRYETTRHMVAHIPMEFFMPKQTDVLCFVTECGVISVRRKSDADDARLMRDYNFTAEQYEVHFPMMEASSVKDMIPQAMLGELAEAFSLPYGAECVEDVAFSKDLGYYVVRLSTARNVLECKPREEALCRIFATEGFKAALKKHSAILGEPRGVAVTAENANELTMGPASGSRVVSRFFAPWMGVSEDPVTGSLYTAITPYWTRIFNKGRLKVGDRVEFYQASSRGGHVTGIIIGRRAERIALIGSVVTFLRGNATFEVEE